MSENRPQRWAPVSGIAYVVLWAAVIAMIGDYPTLDAPADDFVAHYADHRTLIIVQLLVYAVAAGVFLWFAAAVAARVRAVAQPQLAAAVLGSGTAFAAAMFVNAGQGIGAMYVEPDVDAAAEPALVKSMEAASHAVISTAFIALGVFILAFGLAVLRTGFLAKWLGYASLAVAVLVALVSITWAEDGFWSPEGAYLVIGTFALLAWILTVSVLLIRHPPGMIGTAAPGHVQAQQRSA